MNFFTVFDRFDHVDLLYCSSFCCLAVYDTIVMKEILSKGDYNLRPSSAIYKLKNLF